MKSFYSCIDIGCSDLVTQPIQHLVNAGTAAGNGGKITFYTSEDPATLASQSVLRSKLHELRGLDGIVFFRLAQFCHSGQMNFALLQDIVDQGLEVHFSREGVSIFDRRDLNAKFFDLYLFDYIAAGNPGMVVGDLLKATAPQTAAAGTMHRAD